MGNQFLILAKYLTLRNKKKYSIVLSLSLVVLGLWLSPPWLQLREIAPLGPAEVGQDQIRVVGGDTRPSIPYASHILGGLGGHRYTLLFWVYHWLFKV